MEPTGNSINSIDSRAKEIDTGAIPVPMSNVILGLPSKPGSDPPSASVSAASWSWEQLLGQKRLLTVLSVTPSTDKTKPLWEFNHSWRNVIFSKFFNNQMGRLFSMRSWDMNFLFEFRSNFQQVGMLSIVHSNCPPALEEFFFPGGGVHAFEIQTQLPHRLVMMGEDVDVSVCLKWNSAFLSSFSDDLYPNNVVTHEMSYVDDYQMGILRLYAPFPMEVSTGVDANMSIRVWAYLTNIKYAGYTPSDKAFAPS